MWSWVAHGSRHAVSLPCSPCTLAPPLPLLQIAFNVTATPTILLAFPKLTSNPLLYPKTLKDRALLVWNFVSYPCRRAPLATGLSWRSQHLAGDAPDAGTDELTPLVLGNSGDGARGGAVLGKGVGKGKGKGKGKGMGRGGGGDGFDDDDGASSAAESVASINTQWQQAESDEASLVSSLWFKLGALRRVGWGGRGGGGHRRALSCLAMRVYVWCARTVATVCVCGVFLPPSSQAGDQVRVHFDCCGSGGHPALCAARHQL
jgi:hypothetical protein